MDTAHKVAKNTTVIIGGNLLFRLISLVLVIYLANYLGVETFGKYNFIFAYLVFFGLITDLGLGDILVREMSRNPEKIPQMLGNVYAIKLILSLFAIISAAIVISLLDYPPDTTKYVTLASVILLLQSFSDSYRALFQTTLKMKYEVLAKFVAKLFSAALIFYFIFSHGTLLQIISAVIIYEIIRLFLSYIFSRNISKADFRIDFSLWRFLFKESLPIALSGVFLIIYHRIDILMLSMMIGGYEADVSIGLYSAAYKLSEPLGIIPYALIISLFPIMSRSFNKSKDVLIRSYEVGFKFIILIMLPVAFGTTLIADKIIFFIYDLSYKGSIFALQILIWSIFFASLNYLMIMLLTSMDKQKLTTISMGICVLFNIILNYLLIPQYSYIGASISTVFTELVLICLVFYFASKNLHILPIHRILIKPLFACVFMSVPVYYLNNNFNIHLIIIIGIAMILYSIALLFLNAFSTEDKAIIRKVIKI